VMHLLGHSENSLTVSFNVFRAPGILPEVLPEVLPEDSCRVLPVSVSRIEAE
jgi:hypothetical protein